MKAKTIYIDPNTEDITGYTTFIQIGTSTSDKNSYLQTKKTQIIEYENKKNKKVEKEYIIPKSREENFIDKDLSEFYKKKGYQFKEWSNKMPFYRAISNAHIEIEQGDVFSDIYFSALDVRVNAVVITPICDLIQKKAQFVKFISTVSLESVMKILADSVDIDVTFFRSRNKISKKKFKNILKIVRRNTTGDFLPRYYLIPKYNDILPASYLDFQRVFVLPYLQVKEDYLDNRVVNIGPPWRDSITSQYAGYSMRIGTPDYTDDELYDILEASGLTIPEWFILVAII